MQTGVSECLIAEYVRRTVFPFQSTTNNNGKAIDGQWGNIRVFVQRSENIRPANRTKRVENCNDLGGKCSENGQTGTVVNRTVP